MIRHIKMKVSTVLDMLGTKKGVKQLEQMFETPAEDVFLECERLTAKGKIYLDTEGCDNSGPFGDCPGHEKPSEKAGILTNTEGKA